MPRSPFVPQSERTSPTTKLAQGKRAKRVWSPAFDPGILLQGPSLSTTKSIVWLNSFISNTSCSAAVAFEDRAFQAKTSIWFRRLYCWQSLRVNGESVSILGSNRSPLGVEGWAFQPCCMCRLDSKDAAFSTRKPLTANPYLPESAIFLDNSKQLLPFLQPFHHILQQNLHVGISILAFGTVCP